MNRPTEKSGSILGCLLLLTAPLVTAQQAASNEDQIGEVIVTAQKRAENLRDVPIAVSAFSGRDLINFGAVDTQSLQSITPGLVYSNSAAIAQPYLRGVGTRIPNSGLESSIATYVDNRYIARSAAAILDFADIERVEVLKGPQGTMYGRNAAGGAIQVITRDVSADLEGSITASAGNDDLFQVAATLNAPVTEDLGARFNVLWKDRSGYARNVFAAGLHEWDDENVQAYRAKFRWRPSDRITARLWLDYWKRQDTRGEDQVDLSPPGLNVGAALGGVSGEERDEVGTALTSKDDSDEFSTQLQVDAELEHFDFVSVSVFSELELRYAVDGDGTSAVSLDAGFVENDRAWSQEFRLLSKYGGDLEWLLGTFYYQGNPNNENILDVGLPTKVSQGLQQVRNEAWAIFGQATWHLRDSWSLTLGGRWSSERKEVELLTSNRAPVTIIPGLPFTDDGSWERFTPKATIEYRFNDHSMAYVTYARGFKSGGFSYPANASPVLEPEVLDMWELGAKGEYFDKRLGLYASLYYYDYRDLQVTRAASGPGATATTENAANAEVKGLDVDVTFRPTNAFTLTAGASVLDTEYTRYLANAKVFTAVLAGNPMAPGMQDVPFDAAGEPLLRAPDLSAFLSVEYAFSLGAASLPTTISYSYKSAYDFDFIADPTSQPLRQDAYGILNARLSYVAAGNSWLVALWGRNLTDEIYFDDRVANARGLRGSYGVPRTFGIDFTLNF